LDALRALFTNGAFYAINDAMKKIVLPERNVNKKEKKRTELKDGALLQKHESNP
jgi:hypothetical protein